MAQVTSRLQTTLHSVDFTMIGWVRHEALTDQKMSDINLITVEKQCREHTKGRTNAGHVSAELCADTADTAACLGI